jgi:hypothetical protein
MLNLYPEHYLFFKLCSEFVAMFATFDLFVEIKNKY